MKKQIPTLCKTILFGSWVKGNLSNGARDEVMIRHWPKNGTVGELHIGWIGSLEQGYTQLAHFRPYGQDSFLASEPVAEFKIRSK